MGLKDMKDFNHKKNNFKNIEKIKYSMNLKKKLL